jgi:hypothetical protein
MTQAQCQRGVGQAKSSQIERLSRASRILAHNVESQVFRGKRLGPLKPAYWKMVIILA